jgi:heme exporter protein D
MHWSSLADFLAMGGYAPFVWGAYGTTLIALALEIALLRARRRRAEVASRGTSRGIR